MDKENPKLSDISLRWMVKEIIKSGCGIQFDREELETLRINASISTSEETGGSTHSDVNQREALEPMDDRLSKQRLWWLLEIIPFLSPRQKVGKAWGPHFGRGRDLSDKRPVFHKSVEIRMEKLHYTPKAKYAIGQEYYVQ